ARTFNGRKVDLDVVKKEIKDEITHVLYDQTRRTPIVIPVINEVGGGNGGNGNNNRSSNGQPSGDGNKPFKRPAPKSFPKPVVPDSDVTDPRIKVENRGY